MNFLHGWKENLITFVDETDARHDFHIAEGDTFGSIIEKYIETIPPNKTKKCTKNDFMICRRICKNKENNEMIDIIMNNDMEILDVPLTENECYYIFFNQYTFYGGTGKAINRRNLFSQDSTIRDAKNWLSSLLQEDIEPNMIDIMIHVTPLSDSILLSQIRKKRDDIFIFTVTKRSYSYIISLPEHELITLELPESATTNQIFRELLEQKIIKNRNLVFHYQGNQIPYTSRLLDIIPSSNQDRVINGSVPPPSKIPYTFAQKKENPNDSTVTIEFFPEATMDEVRAEYSQKTNISPDDITFFFAGKAIRDDRTLKSLHIPRTGKIIVFNRSSEPVSLFTPLNVEALIVPTYHFQLLGESEVLNIQIAAYDKICRIKKELGNRKRVPEWCITVFESDSILSDDLIIGTTSLTPDSIITYSVIPSFMNDYNKLITMEIKNETLLSRNEEKIMKTVTTEELLELHECHPNDTNSSNMFSIILFNRCGKDIAKYKANRL